MYIVLYFDNFDKILGNFYDGTFKKNGAMYAHWDLLKRLLKRAELMHPVKFT